MILALTHALNNPQDWAVSIGPDGIHLAPDTAHDYSVRIPASKGSNMDRTALVDQIMDIAHNDEFTVSQRKEQIGIAMFESADLRSAQLAAYPMVTAEPTPPSPSFMIDATLGRHMRKERTIDGIRFGFPPAHPPK